MSRVNGVVRFKVSSLRSGTSALLPPTTGVSRVESCLLRNAMIGRGFDCVALRICALLVPGMSACSLSDAIRTSKGHAGAHSIWDGEHVTHEPKPSAATQADVVEACDM